MAIYRVHLGRSTRSTFSVLILFLLLLVPIAKSWTPWTLRYTTTLYSAVDPQHQRQPAPPVSPELTAFTVRPCKYEELAVVADIIMASFYDMSKSPFKVLYRLEELNRLQQNFPYSDAQRHVMLVATTITDNEVVAFCDVDARPATRAIDPPRPYLSDLAVRPDCRRRGVAKQMVQVCERIAKNDMNCHELYIRVEEDNAAAVGMYDGLGYEPLQHHIFGVQDTTVLLRKDLVDPVFMDYVV